MPRILRNLRRLLLVWEVGFLVLLTCTAILLILIAPFPLLVSHWFWVRAQPDVPGVGLLGIGGGSLLTALVGACRGDGRVYAAGVWSFIASVLLLSGYRCVQGDELEFIARLSAAFFVGDGLVVLYGGRPRPQRQDEPGNADG